MDTSLSDLADMPEHSSTRNDQIADTFNVRYRYSEGKRKEDLGRGAEASVYAAVYRGNAVAIKEFHNAATTESKVEREIEFMRQMRGEYHVVQYVGKYVNPEKKVCLVMEVAYNLTLGELLRQTEGVELSRELRVRLAREVCLGVRALHRKGIAHEDIKTDNVLLNFGLRAKLCDFGAAKFVYEDDYPALSGTKHKRAPEKERGGPYDRLRSDIFSLGLLLKEVLHGVGEFSAVLSKCVSKEPGDRPSCDEILAAVLNVAPVGYSTFINVGHTDLNHLEESEKFNISYYWTEYDCDENSDLTQGRALFFKGLYDEAFDYFSSVCEDLPVAHVFLGIMKFHGLGPCKEDYNGAREHFMTACESEDLEEKGLVQAVISYYLAMVLLSINPDGKNEKAREYLHRLDIQGNSFGPTLSARMYAQHFASFGLDLRRRLVAKNLFKAAKAGYSTAEAYLTFFYIDNNSSSTIPAVEMEYLNRSVEGGSALGRLLLDFVNNTINEYELLQTKSPELFMFVGSLYSWTHRTQLARRWFSEALTSGHGAELIAATFEYEGNPEEALVWLLKAKDQYSEIDHLSQTAISEVKYHSEDFQFSPQPSWQLRLAEKHLNKGRLDDARSLVAAEISHTKTWYDFKSLKTFALKSPSARSLVHEARCSLSDDVVFFLAFIYQQSGLRDESVEWLEECVRRGHTEALTTLGTIFYNEANFDRARDFFERGAEGGSILAMFNLGILERDYTMNNDRAVFWLEQAVSKGLATAMGALGSLLVQMDKSKHKERARDLHKRCSELGDDDHLWALVGSFDDEDSEAETMYWINRALRHVPFAVIAEVGIAFEDTSTEEIVNRAAEKGTGQALYNKGMWLEIYVDTKEGDEEAYKIFSTAAEKGHIDSMSKCFIMCEENEDLDGVHKWIRFMEQRRLSSLVAMLTKS